MDLKGRVLSEQSTLLNTQHFKVLSPHIQRIPKEEETLWISFQKFKSREDKQTCRIKLISAILPESTKKQAFPSSPYILKKCLWWLRVHKMYTALVRKQRSSCTSGCSGQLPFWLHINLMQKLWALMLHMLLQRVMIHFSGLASN